MRKFKVGYEDTSRDLAERMKFVPPDLRVRKSVFYWREDPHKIQQRRKSGKWLKVEVLAVKGPMVVTSTGASILQVSKLRRPLDTVDLADLPDARERTGTPVLWPSCEGEIDVWELSSCESEIDVWELFSDNSYPECHA